MEPRLSSGTLLSVWETGAARRPLDRALAILWAAGVEQGAELPLAARDRALLQVRAGTFGKEIEARATCPDCAAALDLTLDAEVLAAALHDPEEGPVRALTSADLAAVAGLPGARVAEGLRERLGCTSGIAPESIDAAIEAQAEEAELTLRMVCAECGAGWAEVLDVPGFVWAELEAAALRLLAEVADLARAFGWTEAEVLRLSPPRRAAYLAMARAS
ncbi:hypothetical protein PVT71_21715 [Salipiger sp. H15]|uniref:Phage baseplate protein n=1 Tax=Alloyangia sp. H15 TaxID=3029062 RepID=A0AAU8AMW0_9RHOB